jgi:dTDP-4-amino-4,6-dideoxygalactose transaminase
MIPLADTTLGEEEVEAAARVLRSGWLTMGPEVKAFEEEFADRFGARHAIGVANGTAALHLAYQAAGLREGDEFCLPALTFVATLNAGLYPHARPVLVDCTSEDDLTLSPSDLERKITPRTRLIVTMPYGGFCPDMERICALADARKIPIVEDACHAPLAELNGRKIGTFGLASTWSFYGNKNMTTGEGGMVLTDDDETARRVRLLRSHGMTTLTWERHRGHAAEYDVVEAGYNYRLDEVRAAIGRVQLRKLDEANHLRAAAARLLREALAPLAARGLRIPFEHPRGHSAHHLFVILLPDGCDRRACRDAMRRAGVMTSVHYPPLDSFSHCRALGLDKQNLPVLRGLQNRLVTLPLGPTLTATQVHRIAGAVDEALR